MASRNLLADEVCVLLRDLEHPNGVAWHNDSLFVMETTRLTRYDNIDNAVLQGCNVSSQGLRGSHCVQ